MEQWGILVPGTLEIEAVEDNPDDNSILAATIEGAASYIVTGEQHLLKLKTFQGIPSLPQTVSRTAEQMTAMRIWPINTGSSVACPP